MKTKMVVYQGNLPATFVPMAQTKAIRGVPVGLPDWLADQLVREQPRKWRYAEEAPPPKAKEEKAASSSETGKE